MSSKILRHKDELKALSRAKPRTVKAIIKTIDDDLLKTLCECCLNVLKGNISITPSQKRRLSSYKKHLRKLSKKGVSRKQRVSLLQTGGLLGALIPAVLSAFLPALFN